MKRSAHWSFLRLLLGISILGMVIFYIDIDKILANLQSAEIIWIGWAFLLTTLAVLIGALNLNLLISHGNHVPLHLFIPIYWTSWAFSLVIPGQLGDLFSLPILLRRYGINWHTSLGRAIIDKTTSLCVLLFLAAWGISQTLEAYLIEWSFFIYLLTGVVAILLPSILICRNRLTVHPLLSRVCHHLLHLLHEVKITLYEQPWRVVVNFMITWIKVGLIGLSYWAVFSALGHTELSIMSVIPLMAASSLVAYLPISFNGLGTVEFAAILLFSSQNIDSATVLTAYLILRGIALTLAWLPAAIWLLTRPAEENAQVSPTTHL